MEALKQKIEAEIQARDKAALELKTLNDAKTKIEAQIEEVNQGLIAEQVKADAILKRGGSLTRTDNNSREHYLRRDVLRPRLERLEKNLVPGAVKALDAARTKLKPAVLKALSVKKKEVADAMANYFQQGMFCYDDYTKACEALFKELDVDLRAGTIEIAPLPNCPDLYNLLDAGLLGSKTGPQDAAQGDNSGQRDSTLTNI